MPDHKADDRKTGELNVQVLFVASECAPFIKTGGLADVAGAVPKALAPLGITAKVMMPAYAGLTGAGKAKQVLDLGELQGGPARLMEAHADGIDLLLLDAPHLYDRPGNPYLGADGNDWPDNHLRYGALCQVAAKVAKGALRKWKPEIVHVHDWQAGLVPAYLKLGAENPPPCVMTIHNIAFQGLFPPTAINDLDLPTAAFVADGYEYYGKIGFLKAGLVYSDAITTVSPTYARELMTPEFGFGLEGLLAKRKPDVSGILNGIDTDVWNPETDPSIACNYSVRAFRNKAANKAALETRFGLDPAPQAPLFCVISRLTSQKGLDLLLEALPRLLSRGARLALLGSGDKHMEQAFVDAARQNPALVGVLIGYDEPLSHLLQAGSDAILVPSRFEPCGLTQLYGLRYGTLPVVARTGGLADTVIDANDAALEAGCATGFQFAPITAGALGDAIDRACDAYSDGNQWRKIVRNAMRHPVDWGRSAKSYAELYKSLAANASR
jgi:starch synthase